MARFAKAIYAFIVAGLASVVTAMVDGGFNDVTDAQWLTAVLAALVAGGGVYGIRNAPDA
jgi:hypothetical protein